MQNGNEQNEPKKLTNKKNPTTIAPPPPNNFPKTLPKPKQSIGNSKNSRQQKQHGEKDIIKNPAKLQHH